MFPTKSLSHESRKILTQFNSTTSTFPPPPYTAYSTAPLPTVDDDSDYEEDPYLTTPPPVTITIDNSTRIMGHCNTIHMPSTPTESSTKLATMIAIALKHAEAAQSATTVNAKRTIDIKVQGGVSICGSRNVLAFGGAAGKGKGAKEPVNEKAEATKAGVGKEMKMTEEEPALVGRKRRAESEPTEMPEAKKTMVRE